MLLGSECECECECEAGIYKGSETMGRDVNLYLIFEKRDRCKHVQEGKKEQVEEAFVFHNHLEGFLTGMTT